MKKKIRPGNNISYYMSYIIMFSNEAGFENLQHVRSFVGQLYEFYINERNISCC